MKALKREIKLAIFDQLIYWAICILPDDCPELVRWLNDKPYEFIKK